MVFEEDGCECTQEFTRRPRDGWRWNRRFRAASAESVAFLPEFGRCLREGQLQDAVASAAARASIRATSKARFLSRSSASALSKSRMFCFNAETSCLMATK